jgi:PTH1 family peptidyl-tRNA hydrolase
MNLSGMAVARLIDKHGLSVQDLIVLVDDVDLPLGSVRIRRRGSAGGHNGMKSVIGTLESDEFVRVRLGVRPERLVEDLVSYVLGQFRDADLEIVAAMLDQASEAVRIILKEGPQKAMNRFNRKVPPQLP